MRCKLLLKVCIPSARVYQLEDHLVRPDPRQVAPKYINNSNGARVASFVYRFLTPRLWLPGYLATIIFKSFSAAVVVALLGAAVCLFLLLYVLLLLFMLFHSFTSDNKNTL